jgi:hypothetical protein
LSIRESDINTAGHKAFSTEEGTDLLGCPTARCTTVQDKRSSLKERGQTCSAAASGKSHQCTDSGVPSGSARRKLMYIFSQKNGVNGAITWPPVPQTCDSHMISVKDPVQRELQRVHLPRNLPLDDVREMGRNPRLLCQGAQW